MSTPPPLLDQSQPEPQAPPPRQRTASITAQEMREFKTLFPQLAYWDDKDIAEQEAKDKARMEHQQARETPPPPSSPPAGHPTPINYTPTRNKRTLPPTLASSPSKKVNPPSQLWNKMELHTDPAMGYKIKGQVGARQLDEAEGEPISDMEQMELDQEEQEEQVLPQPEVIIISSDTEEETGNPKAPTEPIPVFHDLDLAYNNPMADLQQHMEERRQRQRAIRKEIREATDPARAAFLARLQAEHEEYLETISITIFGLRRLGAIKMAKAKEWDYGFDATVTLANETANEVQQAIAKIREVFTPDPIYVREFNTIKKNSATKL